MKTNYFKLCIVITGIFAITSMASAQRAKIYENPEYGADSSSRMECASNLSIMNQYVKINTYEYAYDSWRYCFYNCPKASKNIYIHGAKILKYKIEKEEDEVAMNAYIDTLMMLYDQRMEYFKQPGYVFGIKGIDLLRYRSSDIEEAYGYLEKSIKYNQAKVDESVAVTYITASYKLLQDNKIGADIMINNYVLIMDLLNEKVQSGDKDPKLPQAIENIEKVFAESGAADCESLIAIFSEKFEAEPENVDLLKKITSLLSETGCEKSELYAKAAEALYKLEPSAESAAKLANLFAIREEYSKAQVYYNKAISQETDYEKKAYYYYNLAKVAFQQKDYPSCRKYALSAINLKSNYGEAYILIGTAYAAGSSSCGSDFEKQAAYWAAVDKFIKAKTVDPSVKGIADEQIKTYSQQFPNNEITFFNGYTDGDTYTVGCWINETTIVRTTK